MDRRHIVNDEWWDGAEMDDAEDDSGDDMLNEGDLRLRLSRGCGCGGGDTEGNGAEEEILGTTLSDAAWFQATPLLKNGGLSLSPPCTMCLTGSLFTAATGTAYQP